MTATGSRYFAGCDVGSTTGKAVILQGDVVVATALVPSTLDPQETAQQALDEACAELPGLSAGKGLAYLHDRGGRVVLMPIDAPPLEWESPLAVFEEVYAHEVKVTGLINKLMDRVLAASDHASSSFLQWFVSEQVEEEATADEVLQKLKLVDKTEGGLFLLDQEMDKRTFALPPDLAGVF